MTHKQHLPSKFEEFVTLFAGALGFSILFLFALSAFVNNLYQSEADTGHSPMTASTSPQMPGKNSTGKNTQETHDSVAGNTASTPSAKPPASTIPIGQMLATGDQKKGAKVAKKCMACHSFDKGGKNKVGPNLYAIVGKKIGTTKGYKYSSAVIKYAGKSDKWQYANLVAFLKKPKSVVPKTKMAFAGIRKDKDMANLIAFLRSNASTPVPLPTH